MNESYDQPYAHLRCFRWAIVAHKLTHVMFSGGFGFRWN